MQLDLGGIAAGYIAQKVADFLKTKNITSALVDASGDIICTNPPPGKKGWTLGINQPGETNRLLEKNLEVNNCSVSTSGDVYQYMEHKGKRYSHIIDPKTGYGSSFQRNVTIIANDGTTADWLATTFSLLPLNKLRRISKKMKAEYLITQRKKNKIREYSSQGFKNYWQKTN
jgi:thiamine biosynthesis lipoprotein